MSSARPLSPWALLVVLGLATVTSGCREDPREQLDQIRTHVAGGDLERLQPLIAADYSDAVGDRDDLIAALENLRAAYPRMTIVHDDLEVVRTPSGPRVLGRETLRLAGTPEWKFIGAVDVEFSLVGGLHARSGLWTDLRDIRALMRARRDALEANDAERYAKLLHPKYADGDLDKRDVVARLTSDLAGVRIRHEPIHYRVEVRGPVAHVDERYRFTAGTRTLPPTIARLTLRRSAGRWRIAGGLYRDVGKRQ